MPRANVASEGINSNETDNISVLIRNIHIYFLKGSETVYFLKGQRS